MKQVFAALTAGVVALAAPSFALAQATDPAAVAQATAQNVCGEAAVIRAIFLDDGRMEVTCPRGSVPGATGLGGTTVSTTALAAGAAAVVVIALVAGDDDDASTTTTTTTGN